MGRTVTLKHDLPIKAILGLLLAALTSAALAAKPAAAKPAPAKAAAASAKPRPDVSQRFFEGLLARGWCDLAAEFLDQAAHDPLASAAFREALDFHRGEALFAGRHGATSLAARARQCEQAQAAIERFRKEHPQHERTVDAQALLASVLQERGQLARAESLAPAQTPEGGSRLRADARRWYEAAAKELDAVEQELTARDKRFPKIIGRDDQQRLDARDALRRRLLQVRLTAAGVRFDLAQACPAGGFEGIQAFRAAAAGYAALYERHQPRLAAYYARLGEARCYKELGDLKKAQATLQECLEQPDDPPEFREMKTHATVVMLEILLAAKDYKSLIEYGEGWLKREAGSAVVSDDGLMIRYLLGGAWLEQGRALPAANPERKAALQTARRLLIAASEKPGEQQALARAKLLDSLLVALGADDAPPASAHPFDEARRQGQAALDRMAAAQARPDANAADAAAIASLRTQALIHFQQALHWADGRTPLDDHNAVRYYLAYLNYQADRLPEAIELGEKLAREYPNSAAALPAVQVALSAYAQLLSEPQGAAGAEGWRKMQDLARYASERWPNRPEVDEAWTLVARTAGARGQLELVAECLKKVPERSPRRGEAELSVGRALWSEWRRNDSRPEGARLSPAVRSRLREMAGQLLTAGLKRCQEAASPTAAVAPAALPAVIDLAQVEIGLGRPAEALKWLSDPRIGPLGSAVQGRPTAESTALAEDAYRTSLEAHLALRQLDAAAADLAGFERLLTGRGAAAGPARVATFPAALGKHLKEEFDRLRRERQAEPLAKLRQSYSDVANRFAQDPAKSRFFSLACAVEIYWNLGAAMEESEGGDSTLAVNYYQRVVQIANIVVDRADREADFAPSPMAVVSVKIRCARALGGLRRWEEALELLANVLKARPALVDVQVEAAETYQAWGGRQSAQYLRAIHGGREQVQPDGAKGNLVWGWIKISQMVQGEERFQDVFHRARYNIPLCRVLYAADPGNAAVREQCLRTARREVEIMHTLYPSLGGDSWRPKYDTLMRKIEGLEAAKP